MNNLEFSMQNPFLCPCASSPGWLVALVTTNELAAKVLALTAEVLVVLSSRVPSTSALPFTRVRTILCRDDFLEFVLSPRC